MMAWRYLQQQEYNKMIEIFLILFSTFCLAIIFWLIQPYKNWKKNFDARQYEPLRIITHQKQYRLNEHRMKYQQNSKQLYLSLVVPAYNEMQRLPKMLQDVANYLKNKKYDHQIIIVNDGSQDKTTIVALQQGIKLKLNIIAVQYPKNRGKGGAVRAGFAVARGKYILMVDADGATTFSDLDQLQSKIQQLQTDNGLAMVVGSRRGEQTQSKVQRKIHRKFISWVFKMIITIVLGIKAKDTQCGFKLFTNQAGKMLFKTLHIQRFAFDIELFLLCRRFKVNVGEVGVEWKDIDGSKLSVIDASVNMFRDVLMIRLYYMLGLWKYSDSVDVK